MDDQQFRWGVGSDLPEKPLEVTEDPVDGRPVEWYGKRCLLCGEKVAFIAGFERHVVNGSIVCPRDLARFQRKGG